MRVQEPVFWFDASSQQHQTIQFLIRYKVCPRELDHSHETELLGRKELLGLIPHPWKGSLRFSTFRDKCDAVGFWGLEKGSEVGISVRKLLYLPNQALLSSDDNIPENHGATRERGNQFFTGYSRTRSSNNFESCSCAVSISNLVYAVLSTDV